MTSLRYSLKGLVELQLDRSALESLAWKDFGNGLFMARLAREGRSELVLYRVTDGADPRAFLKHEHVEGEFYLVIQGRIEDESGVYSEGDIVYLDAGSVHTPQAKGEALVLVLWPAGVRVLESRER